MKDKRKEAVAQNTSYLRKGLRAADKVSGKGVAAKSGFALIIYSLATWDIAGLVGGLMLRFHKTLEWMWDGFIVGRTLGLEKVEQIINDNPGMTNDEYREELKRQAGLVKDSASHVSQAKPVVKPAAKTVSQTAPSAKVVKALDMARKTQDSDKQFGTEHGKDLTPDQKALLELAESMGL